jgi:hypothetical protein
MKKLALMVFAGMVFLSLVLTSCSSSPKLDLSTLDPSQPIQVAGIFMYAYSGGSLDSGEFYAKYGQGLRNASDDLQAADKEQLLEILCGTVYERWESITESVKAQTGLTLNGDQFMQEYDFGDTTKITSQAENMLAGAVRYFYSWNAGDYEKTTALIRMYFNTSSNTLIVNSVTIETADEGQYGDRENVRQTTIDLR